MPVSCCARPSCVQLRAQALGGTAAENQVNAQDLQQAKRPELASKYALNRALDLGCGICLPHHHWKRTTWAESRLSHICRRRRMRLLHHALCCTFSWDCALRWPAHSDPYRSKCRPERVSRGTALFLQRGPPPDSIEQEPLPPRGIMKLVPRNGQPTTSWLRRRRPPGNPHPGMTHPRYSDHWCWPLQPLRPRTGLAHTSADSRPSTPC